MGLSATSAVEFELNQQPTKNLPCASLPHQTDIFVNISPRPAALFDLLHLDFSRPIFYTEGLVAGINCAVTLWMSINAFLSLIPLIGIKRSARVDIPGKEEFQAFQRGKSGNGSNVILLGQRANPFFKLFRNTAALSGSFPKTYLRPIMFRKPLHESSRIVLTIAVVLLLSWSAPAVLQAEVSLTQVSQPEQTPSCCGPANPSEFSAQWDFFTNFGQYMPRMNCLRTEAGSPDWFWVISLIVLNVIVVAGYVRIFVFWLRCYYDEEKRDRDKKLLDLAYIFAICATCGYGLATIIFFWPVYRLQAISLVGLAYITWRFALNLEPFRASFAARRLQRQINEMLQRENSELEDRQRELTEANQMLEQTHRELKVTNQSLDEFVYAASHDLKSPLRAIESLSQFIVEDAGDKLPKQSHDDLLQLRRRIGKMESLLDGLLEYARSRKADFPTGQVKLSGLVQECIDVLDVPEGFSVKNSVFDIKLIAPKPPLEQVIRNLIDNGIKHHHQATGLITVTAKQKAKFVEICVSDDGPGIPPNYQGRIFEMFAKYKKSNEVDSNGIGLSVVKRIVEVHGGSISVESVLGKGTTFKFTWPSTVVSQKNAKPNKTPIRIPYISVPNTIAQSTLPSSELTVSD